MPISKVPEGRACPKRETQVFVTAPLRHRSLEEGSWGGAHLFSRQGDTRKYPSPDSSAREPERGARAAELEPPWPPRPCTSSFSTAPRARTRTAPSLGVPSRLFKKSATVNYLFSSWEVNTLESSRPRPRRTTPPTSLRACAVAGACSAPGAVHELCGQQKPPALGPGALYSILARLKTSTVALRHNLDSTTFHDCSDLLSESHRL